MNLAEAPPAPHRPNLPRGGSALRKPWVADFKMRLQQRQHPRHRSQHGDALAANGLDQPRRNQPLFKVQLAAKIGGTQSPIVCPKT